MQTTNQTFNCFGESAKKTDFQIDLMAKDLMETMNELHLSEESKEVDSTQNYENYLLFLRTLKLDISDIEYKQALFDKPIQFSESQM